MSPTRDRCYWSPEFTIQSMEMTTWLVYLTFDSLRLPALGSIKRMKDGGPKSIQIEFELAYFDSNGSTSIKSSAYFRKNVCSREFEFPEMDEARSEFCPKDSVTVRCRIWRKGTEISKSELCFASTHYDVYQRHHVWAVKRFNLVLQGEKRIHVLNGSTKECPQMILILSLAESNGQECVFLHLEAPHLKNVFTVEAEISLLDAEGMVFLSKQERTHFHPSKKICKLSIFEKNGGGGCHAINCYPMMCYS
ncbi:hypothetical protein AVEN_228301-2 [Araneus ventricosus]|uniref:MATH domain-containing protein n=1 Tax=Araneus ventricosus TaxID=182803 RepID=A0A4Y2IH02_ARAVE|nr:hypothetical protein AVEN_228301-2 [Araneus ventricosus]